MDRWAERAACRDVDPELFFPTSEDVTRRAVARRVAVAKAVCASCPVWASCLSWAVEHGQDHGIWGGLTAQERRRLARNHATDTTADTRGQNPDAA